VQATRVGAAGNFGDSFTNYIIFPDPNQEQDFRSLIANCRSLDFARDKLEISTGRLTTENRKSKIGCVFNHLSRGFETKIRKMKKF